MQQDPDFAFTQITPKDLQANVDFMVVSGSTMPSNKKCDA